MSTQSQQIKIKQLSEYDAQEGIKILGRINRALAPYARDKKFISALRACFKTVEKKDKDSAENGGFIVFMELVELMTNTAPGLIIELVSVMADRDKKEVEQANLLDLIDALMLLGEDVRLLDFLSMRFFGAQNKPQSI